MIKFRFVNRKATHLQDISTFKNLTELDVDGNLLQNEVPELKKLAFLKKLSLAGNQIIEMWNFPQTLELLNLAGNQLKALSPSVCSSLCNLKMLDVSNNRLEHLQGVEHLVKLKRLICKSNLVECLRPMRNLTMLIEIDLESNPIKSV